MGQRGRPKKVQAILKNIETVEEYVKDRCDEIINNEFTYEEIKEAEDVKIVKITNKSKRSKLLVIKDIVKFFKDLGNIQPKDLHTIKIMFNLYNEYNFPHNESDYTCNECVQTVYQYLRSVYERTTI